MTQQNQPRLPHQRRTIEAIAHQVIRDRAREYEPELRVVSGSFFASRQVRKRTIDSVVVGGSGIAPNGVDAVTGALVVQTVLVVLQAVATDTASDLIRAGTGNVFRRWWTARKLAGKGVTATADVPELSSSEAKAVGELVSDLLVKSGENRDKADTIAIALASFLSADVRRLHQAADGDTDSR